MKSPIGSILALGLALAVLMFDSGCSVTVGQGTVTLSSGAAAGTDPALSSPSSPTTTATDALLTPGAIQPRTVAGGVDFGSLAQGTPLQ